MQTSGFTGRLVVIGDPDLGLTDCRIEWADGGVVRNVSELSAQIDERIAAFLLARGIAAPDDLVTEPAQETQA
jgi:flagellar assembly protein FliH